MADKKDVVFYLVKSCRDDFNEVLLSCDQSKIPQWLDKGFRVFILGTCKDFDEITKSEIIVEISTNE